MAMLEIIYTIGLLLLVYYLNNWIKYRGKKLPPGPLGLPLVGYLPFLDPVNPHISFTKLANKYGKIYSIQLGSIYTVVLSDVKLIRQAFAQESFSGRAPLFLTHGIMKGNGIICVQGEKWKEQRKFVVNNLRKFGMVKFREKRYKMEGDIKIGVNELIKKLNKSQNTPVDLESLLMHSLGNVVFNLVFGKTWNEEDETWKKLMNLQKEGTKLIGVAGPINFLPILRFIPKYKKIMQYIEEGIIYSHEIYQRILKEYQNSFTNGVNVKESEEEINFSHFLGAFNEEMRKRESERSFYTREQFNYLMADLWGAGVDTTITTLRWFFLYVAHYQETQKAIQLELDEIFENKEINLSDLNSLPSLQAAIAETQRIRSVTPLGIPHGTTEDCYLDGYDIPKGTMIVPLQWAVHMSSEYFTEPQQFRPQRFLNEKGEFVKPEGFIPFQTGKRICLGEEYARMMLFLYGGSVLLNFTLTVDEKVDFEGEVGITLTPKHHNIIFTSRK